MTATLQIQLLGDFRLAQGETILASLPSPRLQSLLAYLVLHRDAPQSRQHLAYVLWPDSSEAQARANLRGLLFRLRRALPADSTFILATTSQIQWNPGSPFSLDVDNFEQFLAVAEGAEGAALIIALRQAMAIYRGDLLPGCYDDWIMPLRERLREGAISCLLRLAEAAERDRDDAVAYEHYLSLTRLNPLWEKWYRGQMRALAGMGRTPEAIAVYNQLQQLLESELSVPPADRTERLAARLNEELEARATARRQNLRRRPPFVGRVLERSRLVRELDRAGNEGGGLAAVLGEAGMGKTRLLEELAQAAQWRGWQVVWGQAEEFTVPGAYAPLAQALAQALPRPRVQQLVHLVSPVWLATIARVVPGIGDLLGIGEMEVGEGESGGAHLVDSLSPMTVAIGHLWQGLQTLSPYLFILDDAQWADPALWPLLDDLREWLAQAAVLLVVSGRSDELRSQGLAWSYLQQWDQTGHPVIQLTGLPAEELEALIRASGLKKLDSPQLERLSEMSDGNPLLVLSLLESGDPAGLPEDSSLASQMLRRLEAISEEAAIALQGAAVIGYQFDYALWEAVMAGVQPTQLPALAGELEQARLIRLEADGYCFAHDTLRASVYHHTPPSRRQRLHQSMLAALALVSPDDVFSLLHHAEQAGDRSATSHYAMLAGERALAAFTYQAAVDFFSRALDALPPDDWDGQYMAVLGRVRALDILAQREAQRADLEQLQALAARLEPAHRVEAAYHWARFYSASGDYQAAEQAAESGLALARRSGRGAGNSERQAALLHMLAQVERNRGQYARARTRTEEARDLYRLGGSRYGEASMTDFLGGLAWEMNQYHEAAVHHAAAARMFRDIGAQLREAMALNNLGTAYWGLGEYGHARTTHERALEVNQALGHRRGEADNLDNLGGVSWVLGDYPAAIDFYEQALAIRRQIGDKWGISISLGNLGSAYRLQGDLQAALSHYDEALQLTRRIGRRLGDGYNLHGRGLALLEVGRLAEAGEALQAALTIRTELGEQVDQLDTLGGLALLALARSDPDHAQGYLEEMLVLLAVLGQVRPALRQWVHYVAHRVYEECGDDAAAVHHLAEARAAMMEVAAPLDEDDRRRFLAGVPLNRQVEAAMSKRARRLTVSVVRAGVPAGRALRPPDYTEVTWTLYSPDDDLQTDPVARRQQIIKRLLAEARSQGAAPTSRDLAAALVVSRRTILRDMKALAADGVTLPGRQKR
jgi:DNA-binding SARP family transcriptional activator/tetratricopeptide (TPR) repeat protein